MIFQSVLLGLIQGITEFIPVSSSGHLVLLPRFFGWEDQGLTFDALLHSATLLAIVWVFWGDIKEIAKGFFTNDKKGRKLGWWIIIASIPAVFVGGVLGLKIEAARAPEIVGASLILWGAVMFLADRYRSRRSITLKKPAAMRWYHALFIGFAQAIALIPGTSRSGITLTAGLFAGMNRHQALRFSFLMGLPVFTGATLLKGWDAMQNGLTMTPFALLVGFVVAFFSGVFAIKFLLKYVSQKTLTPFVLYRIVLGVAVLLLL